MLCGLHIPELFKNVNGSCLLNSSLNSILNSHALVKELYEFTPRTTTLNGNFSDALKYNKKSEITELIIYRCLFSAYIHDTMKGKTSDKDMILYALLHDDIYMNEKAKSLEEYKNVLQEGYNKFDKQLPVRINTLPMAGLTQFIYRLDILDIGYISSIISLAKNAPTDSYVMLDDRRNIFENIQSINLTKFKFINTLFNIILTGDGEYICTDVIMYEVSPENPNFTHVVYYNVLDETLVNDDKEDPLFNILKYIPPKTCANYTEYKNITKEKTVYIPCVLHFQKIRHNPKTLGLVGISDEYVKKQKNRLQFIRRQINKYEERWYQQKIKEYSHRLSETLDVIHEYEK